MTAPAGDQQLFEPPFPDPGQGLPGDLCDLFAPWGFPAHGEAPDRAARAAPASPAGDMARRARDSARTTGPPSPDRPRV